MKWFISNLIVLFCFPVLLFAENDPSASTRYDKRAEKYSSHWQKLIPRYYKGQFAGSIGVVSAGVGWNYYRDHWETDLLMGIVPKASDKHAMATLTLKQNYYPWKIKFGEKVSFEPLSCGVFVNTLLDGDFWGKQPDKYPDGYYWFSTRIRSHIFIGERITLHLNEKKSWHRSISFFYELSTCDLYLLHRIGDHYLKPKDYLSLAFGIKLQVL